MSTLFTKNTNPLLYSVSRLPQLPQTLVLYLKSPFSIISLTRCRAMRFLRAQLQQIVPIQLNLKLSFFLVFKCSNTVEEVLELLSTF